MNASAYDAWIGRTETRRDLIAPAPLCGLAALLDRDAGLWEQGEAPPLAHWLYFLPTAPQSELGPDGHPKRGGFLPPIEAPRRMWAGGRLTFHAPLRAGAEVERTSTIAAVSQKQGASGEMVFVTVRHEVSTEDRIAISEEQDIVYRHAGGAIATGAVETRASLRTREVNLDETTLFRFSALTFNAHRIHYDKPYAQDVEGYPNLVVQGPLIATWLMHHWCSTGSVPRSFSFRSTAPLFAGGVARLCAGGGGELWCLDAAGRTVMSAKAD